MNLPPRDFTQQEQIIAECLAEFGLRYEEQSSFHPYTVDFLIPEIMLVVEADGLYGHFAKRDLQRDLFLMDQPGINQILHITDRTKKRIKEILWQALNKLEIPTQNNLEHDVPE